MSLVQKCYVLWFDLYLEPEEVVSKAPLSPEFAKNGPLCILQIKENDFFPIGKVDLREIVSKVKSLIQQLRQLWTCSSSESSKFMRTWQAQLLLKLAVTFSNRIEAISKVFGISVYSKTLSGIYPTSLDP